MNQNQKKLLLIQEIINRAGPLDPWLYKAFASLCVHWNEALYSRVLQTINSQTDIASLLSNPFALPELQEEIQGELQLGEIIDSQGKRFKIPIKALSQHICVAGFSGSGKSNFGMHLAEVATLHGIQSIRIIDPKADEYLGFAMKYPHFLMLKWNELRFNPLTPPPNVPLNEWYQTIVGHLSQAFNFWQGAEGLLLKHLQNNPKSLIDLLDQIIRTKARFGSKDMMSKATVVSRLQMLLDLFGKTITTNTSMLEQLSNREIILSMSGLMAESESWLTEFLLLWEFMYRVYNPSKRILSLHIFDECQHRLFSSAKEHAVQRIGSSIISKLVDEARSLNIGICSLSQEPSTLIKAVINNSWLKVAFHLGSGSEIKVMREALGLTKEEADILHYLETGQAIVRMAGGYMDALPVQFDEFIPGYLSSREEFLHHQKTKAAELFEETLIEESNETDTTYLVPVTNKPKLLPAKTNPQPPEKPTDAVKPLLSIWLNLNNPFLTQGELFAKAGITSGSKQSKLKKICIRENLIKEHKIQVSKTYTSIWEPTKKAYELIKTKKPKHKSKGGYLHQFIAFRIKEWSIKNNYSVEIEYMLSNNKLVDLALRKNDELILVEIAVSPPLEKEISNYLKDFKAITPDRLIAVTPDKKVKSAIELLISKESRLAGFKDKIEIRLAGEFLKP